MRTNIILALIFICATSCKITTPILTVQTTLPETFGERIADTTLMKIGPWSAFYRDSCLANLLNAAVQNNFSRRLAIERINLANAGYNQAKAGLLPTINASVNGSVDRFGEYTMNGIGNDDTNRSESLPNDKILPTPYPEVFAGLTFSWEANLWGRISSQKLAAQHRYAASEAVAHGITTWLVGAVAQEYYTLLGLDQKRSVLKENLTLQTTALEMSKIQKEAGKVNQLAVDQFEAQLLNTHTRLIRVEQHRLAAEATINSLLGRFPTSIVRDSISHQAIIKPIRVLRPRLLLTNRPDIREKELMLNATHADVDAARAAFYPALRLSGSAGFSAFDLSKLFLTPGSAVYNIGAGLTAPVFQRRHLKALYAAANSRQQLALLDYEQTLVQAYKEVYIVANNDISLSKQIRVKAQEVQVQRNAERNANDLFSVGFASYLEVITAQRRLLDIELELTELRMEQLKNQAAIYRALGGGWQQQ